MNSIEDTLRLQSAFIEEIRKAPNADAILNHYELLMRDMRERDAEYVKAVNQKRTEKDAFIKNVKRAFLVLRVEVSNMRGSRRWN